MPKKMRSSIKRVSPAQKMYEDRWRALQQMWRSVTAFWKKEVVDEVPVFVFRMLPVRDENARGSMENPFGAFRVDQRNGDNHAQEHTNAAEMLMKMPGGSMSQSFDLVQYAKLKNFLLLSYGPADGMLLSCVQILADDLLAVKEILTAYQARFPSNPAAQKLLLEFLLRFESDDKDIRHPVLQHLSSLAPAGSHLTRLCRESKLDTVEEKASCLRLIFQSLSSVVHKYDKICWPILAWIIRSTSLEERDEVWEILEDKWLDVREWWEMWHFNELTDADRASSGLILAKAQACTAFFGADHTFVQTAAEALSERKKEKLHSSQDHLNNVFQRLIAIETPLFELPLKNSWVPLSTPQAKYVDENFRNPEKIKEPPTKRRRKNGKKSAGETDAENVEPSPLVTPVSSRRRPITRSASRQSMSSEQGQHTTMQL